MVRRVIVIGGGISGLCAALEASQMGAAVLLIDRADKLGGAARISGGGICAPNTDVQRERGIEDSVDLALQDWLAWGGTDADPQWAQLYLQRASSDVIEWLSQLGVNWVDVLPQEGNSVPRWHRPEGAGEAVTNTLIRALETSPCRTALGVEVTDISVSPHVTVRLNNGTVLSADAVVAATGGYVDDRERVNGWCEALRAAPHWLSGGLAGSNGSGTDLLLRVGAHLVQEDNIWVYPVGTPDPQDVRGWRGLVVRGVDSEVWLNALGVRFHREDLRGGATGTKALLQQPGSTAWGVFDAATARGLRLLNNDAFSIGEAVLRAGPLRPPAVCEWLSTSPYVWAADRLEEALSRAGLPVERAFHTVTQFNNWVNTGEGVDPYFGRPLHDARPIATPPFYVIQYFPIAQKCLGGIRTSLQGQVLNAVGGPIPGLYAAGEVSGMAGGHINGRAALEGTMLGPSVLSGRIAGRHAAIAHAWNER